MRYHLPYNYTEEELLDFLHAVEGKDIWFKALMDWMYYIRVISVFPDNQGVLIEYYDLDNPNENPLDAFDSAEVYADSINVELPMELMTTEELEEWRRVVEAEYDKAREEWDAWAEDDDWDSEGY